MPLLLHFHTQAPPPASRAARTPHPDDEPAARRAAAHPSQDLRPLPLPCRAHPAHILRRHRRHLQPAARPARPRRAVVAAAELGHPTARGALCACARHHRPQALLRPSRLQSRAAPRLAPAVPPCGLCEPPPRTPVWEPRHSSSNRVRPRWSLVWTLASSSASSLADAKNSSTAVTAGKISLLLVLLGLGTQFSRFAHAQLQAPAHARAPQIHAPCTADARQMHRRCTVDAAW